MEEFKRKVRLITNITLTIILFAVGLIFMIKAYNIAVDYYGSVWKLLFWGSKHVLDMKYVLTSIVSNACLMAGFYLGAHTLSINRK